MKQLVVLLVSLSVVRSLVSIVVAQQGPSTSGAVVIDEDGTVDGDLDTVGGTVVVVGTIIGDVSATAGTILVTGTGAVNGDLDIVAGSVILEGSVGGSLAYDTATATVNAAAVVDGGVRQTDDLAVTAPVVVGTPFQFG